MSTLLKLEFVTQPGDNQILVPRTDSRWGSFQNTYAVWNSFSSVVESITIRRRIELQKGYYYVVGTVDNGGSVIVNGTPCNVYRFDTGINTAIAAGQTRVYHPGGLMDIVINASNAGDVAGVAVTIHNEIFQVDARPNSIPAYTTVTSVGQLVWSTRTPGTSKIGRYLFTMPYSASIEAHVWGAGGAGGAGFDGPGYVEFNPPGGNGSPGLYNTRTFTVSAGDTVEVFLGSGGNAATVLKGGPADGANAPGGQGGISRINVNDQTSQSYNGGSGGQGANGNPNFAYRFGASGGSGGGGGGGASGVLVNNSPVIVAGGGGGGGGSGPAADFIHTGTFGDSNARIDKNATGDTPGDNRGENGRGLASTDNSGGGGGGGGGGYPGGQGGLDRGSATQVTLFGNGGTGFSGECGGNFPIYEATTGSDTLYYDSRYGKGGAGGRGAAFIPVAAALNRFVTTVPAELGQSGTDGRVVLIINGTGFSSIKVANQWREITQAFVKSGNVWREITNLHIKANDVWVPISGGGVNPNINSTTSNYGLSVRNWS